MRKLRATTKHRCGSCERDASNPGASDLSAKVSAPAETVPLPVAPTKVVRVKPKVDLLTHQFFCQTGKELVRRKLTPQEVRGMVSYRIFEGLYHGVRYERPDGTELEIGPDTVEEAFDGRPQLSLPADVPSWADEVISYDRAIADWLRDAKEGLIAEAPREGWYLRLIFIDLALRTPDLDPKDLID